MQNYSHNQFYPEFVIIAIMEVSFPIQRKSNTEATLLRIKAFVVPASITVMPAVHIRRVRLRSIMS